MDLDILYIIFQHHIGYNGFIMILMAIHPSNLDDCCASVGHRSHAHPSELCTDPDHRQESRPETENFINRTSGSPQHHSTPTMALEILRRLARPSVLTRYTPPSSRIAPQSFLIPRNVSAPTQLPIAVRNFSASPARPKMTLIQVLRKGRNLKPPRKLRSPALANRPEMKGVCLKVTTTKPKKPNSGERKIARVRLSSGKVITAYIPGEGV